MSILKAVAIVLVIVCFVSFLRFQSADLSVIPTDQQAYYKDSSGLPFFSEMDSYYNLRMTQDFIDHGHMGTTLMNGTPWDMLSYAPEGRSAEYRPMIVYVTSFLYHLANTFSEMSLKEVAFYAAAIIAPLAAIPAFIIVRRVTNNYGGATAALMVSLAPNYFSHTFAGFFDTDMFNFVLPLFIILFFIESIRSSKFVYRLLYAILTVVFIALFSLAWDGYIFYIGMLAIFMVAYLILGFVLKLDLIKPIKEYSNPLSWLINQKEIFTMVFIAIFGFIGLGLTIGFDAVLRAPSDLLGATQIQSVASASAFPNVYISVAELQIPNLLYGGIAGAFSANSGGIVNGVGGIVALFGSFTILILFAYRLLKLRSYRTEKSNKKPPKGSRKSASKVKESKGSFVDSVITNTSSMGDVNKNKRETLLFLTLFSVWILLSAIAVTQGSRFITVLMIPLGLCVGLFVGYAVVYVRDKLDDKNKLMAIAVAGSLLIFYPILQTFMVFYPIYKISSTLSFVIPIVILIALIGISALLIYGFKGLKGLKGFKHSKYAKTVVILILMFAILSPTIFGAYQTSVYVTPRTGDPMWDSMTWIKENTTNDTTLASWWDFGYLFEVASERPTLFDGGSQTGIRAFWTGKAMTTNDTNLSAAIFEMLSFSGDHATELLDNYTNNSEKSVEILENTLTKSREEAKTTMVSTYKLSSPQADKVINLTHPTDPVPVIFVASSGMIDTAYWWTFFGNWDFGIKNSSGYQYFMPDRSANMSSIGNGKYQANITHLDKDGILYQTILTKGSENNTTDATTVATYKENGAIVKNKDNTIYNPFMINNLIIIEDNIIWKNETVNKSGNYTLFVFGENGSYSLILMSKELENSMFTKLFILGGFGQDTYELVHTEPGISLWKIRGINTLKNETGSTNSPT
jgi:dolichyl-diphosphooligosaccharide--protein glycosyltransferase